MIGKITVIRSVRTPLVISIMVSLGLCFGVGIVGSLYPRLGIDFDVVSFYRMNYRSLFFSGFLTAGSFSLSALTWTLVNLKEKMFDSPEYRQKFEKEVADGNCSPESKYYPLYNTKTILNISVISCLVTSFLQLSVGMMPYRIAVCICVSAAIFSALYLLKSILILRRVFKNWLGWIEQKEN